MFKMKRLLFLVLSISLIGCENKSKNILKVESQTIENENIKETKGQLKEFTNEELAKFTISSIMGQSPKIMKAEKHMTSIIFLTSDLLIHKNLNVELSLMEIEFIGQQLMGDGETIHLMKKLLL